jgi:hypothetical protein
MKFNITIEETVVKTIEIEADNEEQAIDKAIEDYNNGNIGLSSEEVQFKQLSTDCVDWIEF